MNDHQPDCAAAITAYQRALDTYNARWPDHCESCRGYGGKCAAYDPSPAGVSLSPGCMYEFEPCPDCVSQQKCPRCSKPHMPVDYPAGADAAVCPECGWLSARPDGEPEPPECWCFLADEAFDEPPLADCVQTEPEEAS